MPELSEIAHHNERSMLVAEDVPEGSCPRPSCYISRYPHMVHPRSRLSFSKPARQHWQPSWETENMQAQPQAAEGLDALSIADPSLHLVPLALSQSAFPAHSLPSVSPYRPLRRDARSRKLWAVSLARRQKEVATDFGLVNHAERSWTNQHLAPHPGGPWVSDSTHQWPNDGCLMELLRILLGGRPTVNGRPSLLRMARKSRSFPASAAHW
ncbi:hypothetical protein N658DRAFT_41656 [Parathielavia hyrcaniae]|uniref:Uncharacterized protein n=1 Tax=Parathielavia hyrcaniae TaxID=113614 RepID=A0AAN6T1R3_9PEZI|nr:hypothetical protein N658DRAFT_41656 [Parathielavia hyrcaniae]